MPEEGGSPAIHPADPGARRRAGIALIVIVIVGVLAHFALQGWLAELKQGDVTQARTALLRVLLGGAWVSGLVIAGLAAWFWRQGGRVRETARYPLADAKLLRDTPIVEGEAAQSRGRLLQMVGRILLLLAVVEVAGVHFLARWLESLR